MKTVKNLTICACSSRAFIDKDKVARLAALAEVAGWQVRVVPDLCELSQCKDKSVKEIAGTVISACHERAVKSLLAYCGEEAEVMLNNRVDAVEKQLEAMGIDAASLDEEAVSKAEAAYAEEIGAMPRKEGEDAWNPTLDKDVCIECGKCFDFCPFGVYEMVEERVTVVNPTRCKNNCPACARNCPANAIIFPKYEKSPINGGVEKEENAVQLDTKTIYAQTFRERLEERRKMALKLKK